MSASADKELKELLEDIQSSDTSLIITILSRQQLLPVVEAISSITTFEYIVLRLLYDLDGPADISLLLGAIHPLCPIDNLSFEDSHLTDTTVPCIVEFIKRFPGISTLNISSTRFSPVGVREIVAAASQNPKFTHLNVSNIRLSDSLEVAIPCSPAEFVCHGSGLTDNDIPAVVRIIRGGLTELSIGSNYFTDTGHAQIFRELATNTSMTTLGIENHRIYSTHELINMIKSNSTLRDLCLEGNAADINESRYHNGVLACLPGYHTQGAFGDKIVEIAQALSHNTTLESLTLSGNNASLMAAITLVDILADNTSLKRICCHERIDSSPDEKIAAETAFAKLFSRNTTLTSISFGFGFSAECANNILDRARVNTTITWLSILCNDQTFNRSKKLGWNALAIQTLRSHGKFYDSPGLNTLFRLRYCEEIGNPLFGFSLELTLLIIEYVMIENRLEL